MFLLTNKKLMGVKQFAWLLLLQLVGLVHIWSQRSFPVHPSLTQALGIQPISSHPQEHPFLQDVGKQLGSLPLRLGVGGWKKNDFCAAVEPVL